MGMVRVVLDGDRSFYLLDREMFSRGYRRYIDDGPRRFSLPVGSYWMPDPVEAEDMRADTMAALDAADELGASVVATSGPTEFDGLEVIW